MGEEDHASRVKAAARWYADLQAPEAGADVWDAFRNWERDPRNAAAFWQIESALSTLDRSSLAEPARLPKKRTAMWMAAVAAALAVCALGTASFLGGGKPDHPAQEPTVFATAVGEQRVVALEDGSLVTLNTASQIEVAYTRDKRLIRLAMGQALFEVEPGSVPFIVEAAGSQTRALGTAFEVFVKRDSAKVTLIEGSVNVAPDGDASGRGIILAPGDRVLVSAGVARPIEQADLRSALSWRTGVLQFTDIRLADAIAELNRYSETEIVLDDPALADERLSGSFKAGDQEQFVSALVMFLPVEVERAGGSLRISALSD